MGNKERKSPRLKGYDYSKQGVYFITFCTFERCLLFWKNPLDETLTEKGEHLNFAGKIADEAVRLVPEKFPVRIDKYVVMPNHIHILLTVKETETDNEQIGTVSMVVRNIKMNISKRLHRLKIDDVIWQRSFHDHIVRGEKDYLKIWEYIENNPRKWAEDCFYKKQ